MDITTLTHGWGDLHGPALRSVSSSITKVDPLCCSGLSSNPTHLTRSPEFCFSDATGISPSVCIRQLKPLSLPPFSRTLSQHQTARNGSPRVPLGKMLERGVDGIARALEDVGRGSEATDVSTWEEAAPGLSRDRNPSSRGPTPAYPRV